MAGLADLYDVGSGAPPAPEGTIPLGAVDAKPGTKLYELAQRRASSRRAPPRAKREDALASLLSKAVTGGGVPDEGIIPFGDLPASMRQVVGKVYGQTPVVGFPVSKLTPEERLIAEHLRMLGRQEVQQRVDAQTPRPMGPYGAVQAPAGGVM